MQTRESASSVAEEAEFAQRKPSRRYQVTVWSNWKACSIWGSVCSGQFNPAETRVSVIGRLPPLTRL
jgi:hypothetical protein